MGNEDITPGEILDRLCEFLESGEKYWMEKKDHYSSECSISGECGKSMKTFYYNMGQTCMDSSDEIRKLRIPENSEERVKLLSKIREIVERTPVPDELKNEIEKCLSKLECRNRENNYE